MFKRLFILLFFAQFTAHANDPETVFTNIYETNYWLNAESVSGPGSTLAQTEVIRQEIPKLLAAYDINVILDAPCGDFNWFKQIQLASQQEYIGIDIVDELIEKNKHTYEDAKHSFFKKNIISDALPAVDLIFCRDCLVHLTYEQIAQALQNFKKSGARYLLTTTFIGCKINTNIKKTGDWRPLNLELPPFNLPKPRALINERLQHPNAVYQTKSLALWDLATLDLSVLDQTLLPKKMMPVKTMPDFDTSMVTHPRDMQAYITVSNNSKAKNAFSVFKKKYQAAICDTLQYQETARIPKIIHQIWIGPKPFPENCKRWQESWHQLHPDWQYILWDNEKIKSLHLENARYFEEESNWGAKSDILRYEILNQFGGVYVDVDFECIKPFDWLHHCCDFYAGLLEVKRLKGTARLANGIIACSPGHPLIKKLVEEIPHYRHEKDLLRRVGPDFFTKIIQENIKSCPGLNVAFPSNYFFSWSANEILLHPETMAIHYYAGTWH